MIYKDVKSSERHIGAWLLQTVDSGSSEEIYSIGVKFTPTQSCSHKQTAMHRLLIKVDKIKVDEYKNMIFIFSDVSRNEHHNGLAK